MRVSRGNVCRKNPRRPSRLTALDNELQRQGTAATIFIVGGASMALAYNADRATDDVDATFQPRDVVLDAAESVAEEAWSWGWSCIDKSWLSDGVVPNCRSVRAGCRRGLRVWRIPG